MKRLVVLALVLGLAGAAFGDMWIAPMGTGTFTSAPAPNGRVISFSNGIVFDTRQGEPALPAGYRASAVSGVYLVQFSGPVQERWVDELSKAGAVVYSYIPNYSFLVRMDEAALTKVKGMNQVVWVGQYRPAYKVVEPWLFNASGRGSVVMMLFPEADLEATAQKVVKLSGEIKEKTESYIMKVIRADLDLSRVADLAQLPEVLILHSWSGPPTFANNNDQWVCQQGWRATAPADTSLTYRPVWRRGIRGQGQITSLHDSGINFNVGTGHCAFRDPLVPITARGDFPTHRKVLSYKVYGSNVFGDTPSCSYHGTHTCGTTAGNDTIANGTGPNTTDGMAKDAKLNFTDLADANCGLQVGTDLTTLYDTVARATAQTGPVHQHSGSWGWGNSSGTYLLQDASTDAWHWRNKLVLPIYASGNEGSPTRIRNPGIAKNVLTCGATGNSTSSNTLASFSSCGPTQDTRFKPTVCAPGNTPGINSANGATACSDQAMQGTSMATPSVNGAVTLIRQYFRDGWYPTGRGGKPGHIADTLLPSAALLRAMAVCSGDSGVATNPVPPNNFLGFGRLDLDSVLYFDTLGTDARKLAVVDNRTGYATGQYVQYAVNVTDSTLPLRVALAWVDTAAAPNANPTLVNDLNLELQNPAATTYRGNQMAGWRSTPNPAAWDARNVEEIARIVNPRRGLWYIRVRFFNTPQGARVWFGLVVTGGLAPGISGVGGDQVLEGTPVSRFLLGRAVPNPTTGGTRIDYALPVNGNVTLGIYNTTGQLVRELMKGSVLAGHWAVTWNGCDDSGQKVPGGVYFYNLVVNGGQAFSATKRVVILK